MSAPPLSPALHRPEIDGLRALAVGVVILFHAGFGWAAGGFVGVDVFFVISGYLITQNLLRQHDGGGVSFQQFYARRVRRLLPALAVVMLASAAAAWAWMMPDALVFFGQNLLAVAGLASNMFLAQQGDYFAPAAETQALLHTWSLSVEEQFYLVYPALLVFLVPRARRWRVGVLLALFVGSLVFAQWGVTRFPSWNFYLLPSRLWQFAFGGLLTLVPTAGGPIGALPTRVRHAAMLVGLLLIVGATAGYDASTPSPSLWMLVPMVGTALILVPAPPGGLANRLLCARPVQMIGVSSYSAYLWHQPVFAFARLQISSELGGGLALLLAAGSVVLGWATWRWIETPFRWAPNTRWKTQLALVGMLACAGFGAHVVVSEGAPERFPIPASLSASLTKVSAPCFAVSASADDAAWHCAVGDVEAAGPPDLLVWGDSHMESLLPPVLAAASPLGLSVEFAGRPGCPPLVGVHRVGGAGCFALGERVRAYLAATRPRAVILAARWSYYVTGGLTQPPVLLTIQPGVPASQESSQAVLQTGLAQTVALFVEADIPVLLVGQVPEQHTGPWEAYRYAYQTTDPRDVTSRLERRAVMRQTYDAQQRQFLAALETVRAEFPEHVRVYDPASRLCNESVCPVGSPTQAWYLDDDHLSAVGAMQMADDLAAAVRWLDAHAGPRAAAP